MCVRVTRFVCACLSVSAEGSSSSGCPCDTAHLYKVTSTRSRYVLRNEMLFIQPLQRHHEGCSPQGDALQTSSRGNSCSTPRGCSPQGDARAHIQIDCSFRHQDQAKGTSPCGDAPVIPHHDSCANTRRGDKGFYNLNSEAQSTRLGNVASSSGDLNST